MQERRERHRRLARVCAVSLWLSGLGLAALAHEPVARCYALDAETVRCRGGYGHGEDAPGATMDVIAHDGRTLVAGKLGDDSTLTFKRPAQDFYVLFDVGPGHQVVIEQEEIGPLPAQGRRVRWMQK